MEHYADALEKTSQTVLVFKTHSVLDWLAQVPLLMEQPICNWVIAVWPNITPP